MSAPAGSHPWDHQGRDRRENPYSNLGELARLEDLVHDLIESVRAQNEQVKTLSDRVVALEAQVLRADTARKVLIWFCAVVVGFGIAIFDVWDKLSRH